MSVAASRSSFASSKSSIYLLLCCRIKAGWHGNLVLEFSNHTSNSIRLYANSGAAQILFFQGEQPEISYADREGKYQGQTGITLAKSK